MLRILALTIPVLIILAGFVSVTIIAGVGGVLLAFIIIVIGAFLLYWVEKKTIRRLDKETWLNSILNTQDGQD